MLESKSVSQAGGGGGLDIVQKNPFSLSENLDSDYCNSTKIIIKKRIKKSALKLWYWSVISINSVEGLCQVVTARQPQTIRRSPRDYWNNYVSDLLAKCFTCGCNIGVHPRAIGRGNCHLCRKPPLDRVGWRGVQHQRHCQANAQLRRYAISSGQLIKLPMKITYEVISLPQSIWHCSNAIRLRKSDLVPSWIKRRGTGRTPFLNYISQNRSVFRFLSLIPASLISVTKWINC